MRIFTPAVLLVLTSAAHQCIAATVLESTTAENSDYYTGISGNASISYMSLDDWLRYQSGNDHPMEIHNRGFIVDDPTVVLPLYEIVNRLLKHWPGSVPKLPVFVRVDTPASVYGAESLSGNEILIYYGSLLNVNSDDELAAVLAHELAHILLGHTRTSGYSRIALELLEDYEEYMDIFTSIETGYVVRSGETEHHLEFKQSLRHDIVKAIEQRKRAAELYYGYHSTFTGRRSEIEADRLAADLLVKAGYAPIGLKDVLDRMRSSYEVQKLASKLMLESSSLLIAEIKASIKEQIALWQIQYPNQSTNLQNAELHARLLDHFSTEQNLLLISIPAMAVSHFRHPVPKRRIIGLSRYLTESYDLAQRARSRSTHFLENYRQSNLRIIFDYRKLEEVSVALIEGNIDSAVSQGLALLNGVNDSDPYKRYIMHRVRRAQNMIDTAITNVERIRKYYAVPVPELVEMTSLLILNRRFTIASTAINNKERYGHTIPELYPSKIDIALAQENKRQAMVTAVECIGDETASNTVKAHCAIYRLTSDSEVVSHGSGYLNDPELAAPPLDNTSTR